MATLVVGGDGHIDILGGGVGVTEGDHGDVDIGSLLDSLGIGAGIGDDNETGLLERAGDVVGEGTGGEATGNGDGTGVRSELKHGTLTIGTGRDDADIGGVVHSGDDASSKDNLLPKNAKAGQRVLYLQLSCRNNYQVLPMLMTLTPSARVFQR